MVSSGVPGCGSGPPKPADPELARTALERALTAWKAGKPSESLKEESPPIVVNDDAWTNGAQLVKYEIGKDDHRVGADHSFTLVLWTKDKKGKEKKENREYRVGTGPVLTVVRSGFY